MRSLDLQDATGGSVITMLEGVSHMTSSLLYLSSVPVRVRVVIRLGLGYFNRVGLEYCSLSKSLRLCN